MCSKQSKLSRFHWGMKTMIDTSASSSKRGVSNDYRENVRTINQRRKKAHKFSSLAIIFTAAACFENKIWDTIAEEEMEEEDVTLYLFCYGFRMSRFSLHWINTQHCLEVHHSLKCEKSIILPAAINIATLNFIIIET